MDRGDLRRVVIVGNAGSGKSWLAEWLARVLSVPAIDLDLIHWLPDGYSAARDQDTAIAMVQDAARADGWVIEGVYGWLAREALPRATALIWLDIDVAECVANLKQRGQRRGADQASFDALLAWAADYRVRDNANSFGGHQRIVATFAGRKLVLRSRGEMAELVRRLGDP
jgi:adenylate kinase family enzyme